MVQLLILVVLNIQFYITHLMCYQFLVKIEFIYFLSWINVDNLFALDCVVPKRTSSVSGNENSSQAVCELQEAGMSVDSTENVTFLSM